MRNNLSFPEPAPVKNGQSPVWSLVIKDMCDRHASGVAKYGMPLQADNGRDALVDAYQEALDLCVYLRQEIEQRSRRQAALAAAGVGEQWTAYGDGMTDPPLAQNSLGRIFRRN